MKKYTIKDEMFRKDITLLIGEDEAALKKYALKEYNIELKNIDGADACFFSNFCEEHGLTHYILWAQYFNWSIPCQSVLLHEIGHLVFCVLKDVGIPYCRDSEEAYTHYLHRIFEQVWKALKPIHPKIKKKKAKNKK